MTAPTKTDGYGLAERVEWTLESMSDGVQAGPVGIQDAIVAVIRGADIHTGILGGKGHIGCSLCRAVKGLRRLYGFE